MSDSGFDGQPVPYHLYAKQNSMVKRYRAAKQRVEKELEEIRAAKSEGDKHLRNLLAAYQEQKADPRLQLTEEQYNEYQDYRSQQSWTQHEDQFKSALDGHLAEGVTPTQILRAVGYNPENVDNLTPEIIQHVLSVAFDEYPQLFQSVSSQNTQAEPTDNSIPNQMTQAFENGAAQQQQPGRQMVAEPPPQMAPQGYGMPSPQAQRTPMPQANGHQPPQTPSLQFRGYGDLQGRGGPAPTVSPTVTARFRDPAWLAQNQGALAQAVANGANIQSSD